MIKFLEFTAFMMACPPQITVGHEIENSNFGKFVFTKSINKRSV